MNNKENNKRIAKNTSMLYIRMLLTMAVTLYTSRVILNTLGVEDYGIYNVVGGFVGMLGFLNSSMAVATQRFLSFEIGKKENSQLSRVFSMSMSIHILIAFIILILAETVGIWFVKTQLTIPAERMNAALWVFHFSVLTFVVNVISVPYNATIIAHERMNVFAWVSIIDVSLKLLIVFVLQWFGYDKLKFYAVLMFGVALVVRLIYGSYCSRNFAESKYHLYWDKSLFKTIMSFAGWTLWESLASIMNGQGVNILLNIFFGPVINASRAISFQVRSALNSFVNNFQIALKPQIIKSFASGDLDYMHKLVHQGAKYSFFLLFILSLPVLLETEIILRIWLESVPDYTLIFTRLVIINILINSFSSTLSTAAQATGKVKYFQLISGGLILFILPISYLFLKLGYKPQVTLYISIIVEVFVLIARLLFLNKLIKLKVAEYFKLVVLKSMFVGFVSSILPLLLISQFDQSFYRLIFSGGISIVFSILIIYTVGLNKSEKKYILLITNYIKKRITR